MNATWHLPTHWTQRLDQAREQAARLWNEAPPWVRSRAAIAGAVAIVIIGLLLSLAMVVSGVVERSEQQRQAQAEQRKERGAKLMASARLVNASPGVDRVSTTLAQLR